VGTTDDIKQLGEASAKTADGVKQATSFIGSLNQAVETLGKGLSNGTTGFEDLTSAAAQMSDSIGKAGMVSGSLLAMLPGLQGVGGGVAAAFSAFAEITKGLSVVLGQTTKDAINLGDSFSKPVRDLDRSMLDLTKSFGMGIDAARAMTDSIPEQALTDFSRAASVSTGELRGFLASTKGLNLTMDTLTQKVSTAYGNLDLYTVATVQASAAGITTSESARLLETAISKQGMSAEMATEVMAGFSQVANETGISFSTVANTLNSAVNQFNKLGMSADFGRPILENFAKTVKDVGLGIDVATDSTQSLVSALGGLSDNYGLAYLTQIRGGGGATSGGVLGTSIEMRQSMREAEATGDQGSMAIEMAKQLKDTIASMTGGNIITLEQAASSPDLQSQFYMQGQMLSQYGIRDTATQDAVLDLLSKIDEAGAMGDSQGQEELAKQLSMEIESRDATLDEMQKLNTAIGSLTAEMFTSNRNFGEYMREFAAAGAKLAERGAEKVVTEGGDAIKSTGLSREDAIQQRDILYDALAKFVSSLGGKPIPADANIDGISPGNDSGKISSLTESFKEALYEVFKGQQVVKIELGPNASRLVEISGSEAPTLNSGNGSGP